MDVYPDKNMEVRVCSLVGDIWRILTGGGGVGSGGGGGAGGGGGGGERQFSHESEKDLAVMVNNFLEDNGNIYADSWCSSDSDSTFSDLHHLHALEHRSSKERMNEFQNIMNSSIEVNMELKAALSCEEAKFELYKLVKGGNVKDELINKCRIVSRGLKYWSIRSITVY